MRAALALALAAAACGVGVVGEQPLPGPAPNAGPTASLPPPSSSSSGGPSDGGNEGATPDGAIGPATFCSTVQGAQRCLDFDDSTAARPSFGFDEILTFASDRPAARTLEDSFRAPLPNKALAFAFPELGPSTRDVAGKLVIAGYDQGKVTKVTLDVDLVLDDVATPYEILVGFNFGGSTTSIYSGLALAGDGLHHIGGNDTPQKEPRVADVPAIGKPFHVQLVAFPKAGATDPTIETVAVDGVVTPGIATRYFDCNVGEALIGPFFGSNKNKEHFKVRYDQVVLRIE